MNPDVNFPVADDSVNFICVTDNNLKSRILYCNPVTMLLTRHPVTNQLNVMILSWLTPINNDAKFIFSINCHRYTSEILGMSNNFVLCVPVAGMEKQILCIGKCSGRNWDKFNSPNVNLSLRPFGNNINRCTSESQLIGAVEGCVADLGCHIISITKSEDNLHFIVTASIDECYINSNYWDGKRFCGLNNDTPSLLSFLGSQTFAYISR